MMNRLTKLAQAYTLIEDVRDSLSCETSICKCCGLKNYSNFDQHQVREHMNAILNRLEKSMEWMRNEPKKFMCWMQIRFGL